MTGHINFYTTFNVIQAERIDCEFLLFEFMLAKVYPAPHKAEGKSCKNKLHNSPAFKDKPVDTL